MSTCQVCEVSKESVGLEQCRAGSSWVPNGHLHHEGLFLLSHLFATFLLGMLGLFTSGKSPLG